MKKIIKWGAAALATAFAVVAVSAGVYLALAFSMDDRGLIEILPSTNLIGEPALTVTYRDCSSYAVNDIYEGDPRYDASLGKYCVRIIFRDAYGSSEKYREAFSSDGVFELSGLSGDYEIRRGHSSDDVESQTIYVFSDKPFARAVRI